MSALAACGTAVDAPTQGHGVPTAAPRVALGVRLAPAALADIEHVWLLVESLDDPENPTLVDFVDMPSSGSPMADYPFGRQLTLAYGSYRFEARAYDSFIGGTPAGFGDAAFTGATLLGVGIAGNIELPDHGNAVDIAMVTLGAETSWEGIHGPIVVAIGGSDSDNNGIWDVAATIRYGGSQDLKGTWTDDCAGSFGNAAPTGADFDDTAAPLYEVSTTWTDPNWPAPTNCLLTFTVEEDVGTPLVRHRLTWTVTP